MLGGHCFVSSLQTSYPALYLSMLLCATLRDPVSQSTNSDYLGTLRRHRSDFSFEPLNGFPISTITQVEYIPNRQRLSGSLEGSVSWSDLYRYEGGLAPVSWTERRSKSPRTFIGRGKNGRKLDHARGSIFGYDLTSTSGTVC